MIEDVNPSYQRLLESVSDEAAYLSVPGLYGRYRTRLELHRQAPPTPTWCEDIAETSLHMEGEPSGLQMGSFDTFSRPFGIPAGWYRLRYCTEKQDAAATQDEFTGEDYTIYEGRHLLQVWRAPRDVDRTIRIGSAWARALERG